MESDEVQFDPDFEGEDGFPYIYLLGKIVYDFNFLEHSVRIVLWSYVGDIEFGAALTRSIGNVSLADTLTQYCAEKEEDAVVAAAIRHGAKAFNICRMNRNSLAHAMNVDPFEDRYSWNRFSKGHKNMFDSVVAGIEEMNRVDMEIAQVGMFFHEINLAIAARTSSNIRPRKVPDLVPMPSRLLSKSELKRAK